MLVGYVKVNICWNIFGRSSLQAGYDIRTIQKLLGHADVRTTMIYTHCLPGRPEKEVKSPLDF